MLPSLRETMAVRHFPFFDGYSDPWFEACKLDGWKQSSIRIHLESIDPRETMIARSSKAPDPWSRSWWFNDTVIHSAVRTVS